MEEAVGGGGAPRLTPREHLLFRCLVLTAGLAAGYLALAYVVTPALWRRAIRRHPALTDGSPRCTKTPLGIPGDPLNIAIVASEGELIGAMLAAGWHPADPVTLRSSVRIAKSTIFHRPYDDAPVSTLTLWGRKQDLAYEQEVGHDARERHHVRFWASPEVDEEGRPMWYGAATFDSRVGLSHTTGQITHHIAPNLDLERDKIVADLRASGVAFDLSWADDFQAQKEGKNGGGDPYFTDGRLAVVRLGESP
jgi:hypothetical protein